MINFRITCLCLLACGACTEDSNDIGEKRDAGAVSDAATDSSKISDAQSGDSSPPKQDASGDTDASQYTAVVGARCALPNRLGAIEVQTVQGKLYASSSVFTEKNPGLGSWKVQDSDCRFHQQSPQPTPFMPKRPKDAKLVLVANGQEQTFLAGSERGEIDGEIILPGQAFSGRFSWSGVTVSFPAITVPAELVGLKGKLKGSSESPEQLDITWDKPNANSQVHTIVPINHHAGGDTFTECDVPSSKGNLKVAGAMLKPLAVITGLEFQGINHVRFAAAETPLGCIEIQFFTRFIGMPPAP
ncbi:MAG: hypothetical protein SF187_28025 [Deltaproteobacteria bacterium]|nr:hypothetical protein [Deltaproteobacteria bacterium]